MLNTTVAPWPAYSSEECDATADVLRSNRVNYWTGNECRRFEVEFADWTKSAKAIALANGTVALDLALAGLGIGPGDEVVVTPRTFIASVSTVVSAGAIPVFADIDLQSGNITPESVARVITPRTRAVIPVHLAGWACDMTGFMALAEAHDLKVVEDCAQAHGAMHAGRSVGTFGHVGAWSFCQDKIMSTAGEGGMVTTDDEALWKTMWSYKDHGKSWDAVYDREHAAGFRWLHESFGTNWRMLEVQAAVGRIQLRRMAEWTAARTRNAMALAQVLDRFPAVRVPRAPEGDTHAFYRLYAYVRPDALADGWSRDRIVSELTALGVPAYQGSCAEVYLEHAFDKTPFRPSAPLPNARELGATSLMFLTHPTLTPDDLDKMCSGIERVFTQAQR